MLLQFTLQKGPCHTLVYPLGYQQSQEIEQVLSGMSSVVVYLDDILVSSRSTEEHLKTLDEALQRLQEAGLKVRTWD